MSLSLSLAIQPQLESGAWSGTGDSGKDRKKRHTVFDSGLGDLFNCQPSQHPFSIRNRIHDWCRWFCVVVIDSPTLPSIYTSQLNRSATPTASTTSTTHYPSLITGAWKNKLPRGTRWTDISWLLRYSNSKYRPTLASFLGLHFRPGGTTPC